MGERVYGLISPAEEGRGFVFLSEVGAYSELSRLNAYYELGGELSSESRPIGGMTECSEVLKWGEGKYIAVCAILGEGRGEELYVVVPKNRGTIKIEGGADEKNKGELYLLVEGEGEDLWSELRKKIGDLVRVNPIYFSRRGGI